jgi:peptide/nickel transport system substrate-binding protein
MSIRDDNRCLETLIGRLREGGISRRRFLLGAAQLGIAAPVAGALAAASRRTAAAPRAWLQDNGKTLVVAIAQQTVQLDPAIAGSNGYGDILPLADNMTEGLTRFKPGTIELEPALAEKWEQSADGLSYVFHLRPNVKFHDGTPFDGKAAALNITRQLDEKNPYHFEGITYAEIAFSDVVKAEATGDLELTLTLSKPSVLVPGNLAVFAANIVSPAALEKAGKDFGQAPVGTGPFKFDHWTKDVELVMTAYDDYWGGRPKLDRVIWQTISDDTVRLSSLQTGAIDVANQIDFKDASTVKNDPNLQLLTGPFLSVQFLAFNQAIAPFDNPQLRQAVQHAINKKNIADAVFYGQYTLGAGPIAPTLLGYDPSLADLYPYDVEKAKSLVAESGASNVSFTLINRSNSFWPTVGQLIQADLAAIGITANLQALEDADFYAQLNASKAQAFINDWTWDNADPDNVMFSLFTAPRAVSRMGYKNDRVNELNTAAQSEPDPKKREAMYDEAQKLILQDAIMVVLGYPSRAIGAAAKVQNLKVSPIGSLPLRTVELA